MPVPRDFADYCCELLSSLGRVQARRMFGGWGLSVEGLTVAIVADLGNGDTLWLKADSNSLGGLRGRRLPAFQLSDASWRHDSGPKHELLQRAHGCDGRCGRHGTLGAARLGGCSGRACPSTHPGAALN